MLVSNTSTLVLLAKVQCLEAFIGIGHIIEIPSQVKQESLFDEGSYYARLIQKLIAERKIKVTNTDEKATANVMSQFRLHKGEAAAYVLFNGKKHGAILTDDWELIKLCRLNGVPFICAMAIVIILNQNGTLTKKEAVEKLNDLFEIGRYSEKLYEHFKSKVS